jgi:hypothetical protein
MTKTTFKILSALFIICVIFSTYKKTDAVSKETMIQTINKISIDYQAEKWEITCVVGGKSVSLWAVLYALAIQEWWRKDGSIWDTTNNWGSLHKAQWQKPTVGVTTADNTKSRPIYKTPEDGVYEKAHLIVTKYNKCNITRSMVKKYVKWPRAVLDRDGKRYIDVLYSNLIKRSLEYDKLYNNKSWVKPALIVAKNTKTENVIRSDKKVCYKIKTIQKWDYIQADNGDQNVTVDTSSIVGERLWLYSCYHI